MATTRGHHGSTYGATSARNRRGGDDQPLLHMTAIPAPPPPPLVPNPNNRQALERSGVIRKRVRYNVVGCILAVLLLGFTSVDYFMTIQVAHYADWNNGGPFGQQCAAVIIIQLVLLALPTALYSLMKYCTSERGKLRVKQPANRRYPRAAPPRVVDAGTEINEPIHDDDVHDDEDHHTLFGEDVGIIIGTTAESFVESYGLCALLLQAAHKMEGHDVLFLVKANAMIPFLISVWSQFRYPSPSGITAPKILVPLGMLMYSVLYGLTWTGTAKDAGLTPWQKLSPLFISVTWWSNFIHPYAPDGPGKAEWNNMWRFTRWLHRYAWLVQNEARYRASFFKSVSKAFFIMMWSDWLVEGNLPDIWHGLWTITDTKLWSYWIVFAVVASGPLALLFANVIINLRYHWMFVFIPFAFVPILTRVATHFWFCGTELFTDHGTSFALPDCGDSTAWYRIILSIFQGYLLLALGSWHGYRWPLGSALQRERNVWSRSLSLAPPFHVIATIALNRRPQCTMNGAPNPGVNVPVLSEDSVLPDADTNPPGSPTSMVRDVSGDDIAASATAAIGDGAKLRPGRLTKSFAGSVSRNESPPPPRRTAAALVGSGESKESKSMASGARLSSIIIDPNAPGIGLGLNAGVHGHGPGIDGYTPPSPFPASPLNSEGGHGGGGGGAITSLAAAALDQQRAYYKNFTKIDHVLFICSTLYREDRNEVGHLLTSYRSSALQRPPNTIVEFHIVFDGVTWPMMKALARGKSVPGAEFLTYLDEALADIRASSDVNNRYRHTQARVTNYGYRGEVTNFCDQHGCSLFIHYKDPSLVRKRKRWSQVLYMFILQERLRSAPWADRAYARNKFLASQVYVLMTDGDIIFKSSSVRLLLEAISRDPCVGGACARLKPQGNGIIAWVQQWEYSIAHWLQKAGESELGSVLCASSCFSIFRYVALESVLPAFALAPLTAEEYHQYEQGEDRWMCTLLIKQGWSLVYCAAAEALTFCPDTFDILWLQRRRWTPSTLSNLDRLLREGESIIQRSESVSGLFLWYTKILMFSSVVTPSTSLLVLIGGWQKALGLNLSWPLIFGLFIPILYGMFCLFVAPRGTVWQPSSNDDRKKAMVLYGDGNYKTWRQFIQLRVGAVLCVIYSVLTFVALVGTAMEVAADPLGTVSLFLISVVALFAVSAFVHGELHMLLYGFVYLMSMIPTQVFMIIFIITNCDVLDWGTRQASESEEKRLVDPITECLHAIPPTIVAVLRTCCNCLYYHSDARERAAAVRTNRAAAAAAPPTAIAVVSSQPAQTAEEKAEAEKKAALMREARDDEKARAKLVNARDIGRRVLTTSFTLIVNRTFTNPDGGHTIATDDIKLSVIGNNTIDDIYARVLTSSSPLPSAVVTLSSPNGFSAMVAPALRSALPPQTSSSSSSSNPPARVITQSTLSPAIALLANGRRMRHQMSNVEAKQRAQRVKAEAIAFNEALHKLNQRRRARDRELAKLVNTNGNTNTQSPSSSPPSPQVASPQPPPPSLSSPTPLLPFAATPPSSPVIDGREAKRTGLDASSPPAGAHGHGSPSTPPAAREVWTCSYCTFEMTADDTNCGQCGCEEIRHDIDGAIDSSSDYKRATPAPAAAPVPCYTLADYGIVGFKQVDNDMEPSELNKRTIDLVDNYLLLDWWSDHNDRHLSVGPLLPPPATECEGTLHPTGVLTPPAIEHVPSDIFDFRNRMVVIFLLANLLWAATIITVSYAGLTFMGTNPLGLVALSLFAVMLLIQFAAMMRDRLSRLQSYVAQQGW